MCTVQRSSCESLGLCESTVGVGSAGLRRTDRDLHRSGEDQEVERIERDLGEVERVRSGEEVAGRQALCLRRRHMRASYTLLISGFVH